MSTVSALPPAAATVGPPPTTTTTTTAAKEAKEDTTDVPSHAAAAAEAEDEDDPDSILAALEAETEDDNGDNHHHHNHNQQQNLRESRAQRFAEELRAARQYAYPSKTATATATAALIQTLTSDDEVLKLTTQNDRCLVHFSHPDFPRCEVMDTHLGRLAIRHGDRGQSTSASASAASTEDVKFARVDARCAPFVVGKLGVRVLPCLVGFRHGVAVGRMVGFEGVEGFQVGVRAGGEDCAEEGVRVTRGIEGLVVRWRVFDRLTKGWGGIGVGSGGGSDEDEEDEEEEEETTRRMKGGGSSLFGNARRGIQGGKKKKKNGVTDDDEEDEDDDWD